MNSNLPFTNIPGHWRIERLDRLFRTVKEPAHLDDPPVTAFIDGVVTLRSNRPDAIIKSSGQEIGYKHLEVGDLVISGMNAHLGGLGISDSFGKCTPVYTIMRKTRELDQRYISYYLWHAAQSGYIKSLVNAVRYNSSDFGQETVKKFMVPVPPLMEQQSIADYLDLEVPKITQLENLVIQQSAKVDELFTASVNERLQSVSSGKSYYFRYLVKESNNRANYETDLPLLSVSKYKGIIPRSELMNDLGRADSLDNYKICDIGDLVVNRMSAPSGALGLSSIRGVVSPDYSVLKPSHLVDPQYLEILMKSPWFIGQMVMRLRGIGGIGGDASVRTPRVSMSDLGDILIRIPDINEQKAIASKFIQLREDTRSLLDRLDEVRQLAVELKSSIVTGAVTATFNVSSEKRSA